MLLNLTMLAPCLLTVGLSIWGQSCFIFSELKMLTCHRNRCAKHFWKFFTSISHEVSQITEYIRGLSEFKCTGKNKRKLECLFSIEVKVLFTVRFILRNKIVYLKQAAFLQTLHYLCKNQCASFCLENLYLKFQSTSSRKRMWFSSCVFFQSISLSNIGPGTPTVIWW